MKKLLSLAIGLVIMGLAPAVLAVEVETLYQASIVTSSQSESERIQLVQRGLGDVFIKVSGNPHVLEDPAVKDQLQSAQKLLQEYTYHLAGNAYLLEMHFDARAVNRALAKAKVSIWGKIRPLVLVLAVYETPRHEATIIADDAANPMPTLFKASMDKRGLPVVFPVMDIQDLGQVTPTDITTLSLPGLHAVAKRYGGDALLVGRILSNPGGYLSRWTLFLAGDQWTWNIAAETQDKIFATLADYTADTLAGRYAFKVGHNHAQTKLVLKVTGVTHANDLDKVVRYIQHIASVKAVEPVQLLGDDVILHVKVQGDEHIFTRAVALGTQLVQLPDAISSELLTYEWNE